MRAGHREAAARAGDDTGGDWRAITPIDLGREFAGVLKWVAISERGDGAIELQPLLDADRRERHADRRVFHGGAATGRHRHRRCRGPGLGRAVAEEVDTQQAR